jgi:hypothetical protein
MRGKISKHKCVICEKIFDSFRSDAKTCSNACRAKLTRSVNGNTVKKVKDQARVIQTQAQIIDAVLPNQEIKQTSYHLSYSRNRDQINKIIRELNVMRSEAEQSAIADGRGKEHWSPYVKDSEKFKKLCRMIQNMSK